MSPGFSSYTCPVCSTINTIKTSEIHREGNACNGCGCNTRFRATILSLLAGLSTDSEPSYELSKVRQRMTINGIGISDSEAYAAPLALKFNYINTYLHKDPRLDIEDIQSFSKYKPIDFIICSDVLEHTLLPPSEVIPKLYQSLQPGGLLVLVAPTYLIPEHIEKYPSLASFEVVPDGAQFKIVYKTKYGVIGEDSNPYFHGGPGRVLELRILSDSALQRELKAAGFYLDTLLDESLLKQYGSWWPEWVERSEFDAKAIGKSLICKKGA